MTESFSPELTPRSSDEVLETVGFTPESLHGRNILFFGNGVDQLQDISAEVEEFDIDAFLTFDEVSPPGLSPDVVIGVDNDYLDLDVENSSRVDLLEAVVRSINEGGELRINLHESMEDDDVMDLIVNATHAMYDRDLDVAITIGQTENAKYLKVIRK